MGDVTDYRDLLIRYMTASANFVSSIPYDVVERSEGASDALHKMTVIAMEVLILRVGEL